MGAPQIYKDKWYRRVPTNWKTPDGFRTDIRPNILANESLCKAFFILSPDESEEECIMIPIDDLRKALINAPIGKNGSITFTVSLLQSTVNEIRVSFKRIKPKE